MVAAIDEKIATRVGKLAFFDILDPCAVDTDRYIMLRFASDGTGMSPDAFPMVNNKGILRHSQYFL